MLLSQRTLAVISQLWEAFEACGIPPHLAIEQVSFLILLKLLEVRVDAECTPHGLPELVRWRALRTLSCEACLDHLRGPVCAWLRESAWATTMPVLAQATLTISKAHVLAIVMRLIDDLFAPSRPPAVHAAIYEALLKKAEEAAAAWAQPAGQYFTPMHIARLLVDLVQPQPGESIADLACGNGRLLLAAYQHVQRTKREESETLTYLPDGSIVAPLGSFGMTESEEEVSPLQLFGVDRDPEAAWQAWMHLFCLGVSSPHILVADALSSQFHQSLLACAPLDVVLANPPFGSALDRDELDESLRRLGTSKAEVLFLELIVQALRPGGRAAVIVPDGVLFGRERACVALRRKLVQETTIHAVVSLPQGVFLPSTSVKTSVLLFTRGGRTERLWFYSLNADGTSLDARHLSRPEQTDLPDLLVKYHLRTGGRPLSAFVNEQTWFCWDNVDPAWTSHHYTRPLLDHCYVLDDDCLPTKITVCHGAMAVPLDASKDWQVPVAELGEDVNLVAGRYAPLMFPAPRKQKKGSLSPAQGAWKQDEVSNSHGYRSHRGRPRPCEDVLAEVFRLPKRRNETTLQVWFDQGVGRLFVLRDEGMLTRDDVRQLIELLLEVQRRHTISEQSLESAEVSCAHLTPLIGQPPCTENKQLVMLPLALDWEETGQTALESVPIPRKSRRQRNSKCTENSSYKLEFD